jgi:hypothetical protein
MRRVVAAVLLTLAAPTLVAAIDHPISGAKVVLKQSSSGKQKLVFQSRDPSFPFPPASGSDDPENAGATIEVITPGATGGPFTAPANAVQPGWTFKNGSAASFKYKRDKAYAATTTVKSIVIKTAHGISVLGDAHDVPLDGARGSVAIRVTIGGQRSCALFIGASVTKDAVGTFLGKNAPAPADCGATTLTGQPPTCGDGEVNQPSEECDGVCNPDGLGPFECAPPGAPNECTCCSDGYPSALPCCNPSSIAIGYPPSSKLCVPSGCAPPYTCRTGDTCRPDESCCTTNNANLCMQAYAPPYSYAMVPLVPCCAGLECSRYALPQGGYECCASGGTSCAGDGDCCTGHCQLDGTCEACRAAGAGCGNGGECCSTSCTGGVCDACAPTNALCSSNAPCCSGTCSNFHCQP